MVEPPPQPSQPPPSPSLSSSQPPPSSPPSSPSPPSSQPPPPPPPSQPSPSSVDDPASRTRLLRGNPAFRSLFASRAVSFVGDGIATTALVLLVAPRDGPAGVGVLLLANALPQLGGPLAGALADRVQTRRLLMRCDLASALVIGLIAVILPPLPVLTALVAVAGILATIRNPAGRSLVPDLVAAAERAPANALFGVARTLTLTVGPGLGGLLGAAPGGVHTALAVDAATFVVSALLLTGLPPIAPIRDPTIAPIRDPAIAPARDAALAPARDPAIAPIRDAALAPARDAALAPARDAAVAPIRDPAAVIDIDIWAEATEGLRYIKAHRQILVLVLSLFLLVAFAAVDNVALVFLTSDVLLAGPAGYGLASSAFGVGMLLASLACTRLARGRSPIALLIVAVVATGAGTVINGLAPVLAVVVAAQLIAGAGNAVENIGYDTVVQDLVPRPFLGRVFGTMGTAAQLGAAFAYAAGSFLVGLIGPRATFVLAGVGTFAVLLVLVPALGRQPRGDPPA